MARYMITHSLLYSWLYAMQDNPHGGERDAYQEFLQLLRREPTHTPEAMQMGIDFENLVTDILHDKGHVDNKWFEAAFDVADIIRGGVLQLKAKRDLQVNGLDILLYGRLDALKAGVVYDIKFSKTYERGKYLHSTQHPVYLSLLPEAREFSYLVSNGSSVWQETYRREETEDAQNIISDFLVWLDRQGLMELYKEKWVTL